MKWLTLMVVAAVSSVPAFGYGPVAEIGAVVTPRDSITQGSVTIGRLAGPVVRVGFEVGDRFNNEFDFEFTSSTGTGAGAGVTVPVSLQTFAGRYTWSVDFLGKKGFSPTLGVGLSAGAVHLKASIESPMPVADEAVKFYLVFHAVAGVRYVLWKDLSLRATLTLSTYGGFIGLLPVAGASWRF